MKDQTSLFGYEISTMKVKKSTNFFVATVITLVSALFLYYIVSILIGLFTLYTHVSY